MHMLKHYILLIRIIMVKILFQIKSNWLVYQKVKIIKDFLILIHISRFSLKEKEILYFYKLILQPMLLDKDLWLIDAQWVKLKTTD